MRSKMSKSKSDSKKRTSTAKEPVYVIIVKVLMLAVCTYSVVFWGSVALIGIFRGAYSDFGLPVWAGIALAAGEVALICALVLSFMKKNTAAFILSVVGAAAFLASSGWFVSTLRTELENRAVSNDLLDMDKRYAFRLYPAAVIPLLAAVPVARSLVLRLRSRRQKRLEKENAPVKSIID